MEFPPKHRKHPECTANKRALDHGGIINHSSFETHLTF
jgi:hypothetical protein